MKIKIAPNTTFKMFKDIKPGECFMYHREGEFYIKVSKKKGCSLKDGKIFYFYSDDEVIYLPEVMLVNVK